MNKEIEETENENVGELLRNTRLKSGKTLSDVSKSLCIRKGYLEAIETFDCKNLPPMPYGLGFVRSYAEYLGLDSNRIANLYKKTAFTEEEAREYFSPENSEDSETGNHKTKQILVVLGLLLIVIVAWTMVTSYQTKGSYKSEVETDSLVEDNTVIPEPVIIDDTEDETTTSTKETTEQSDSTPSAQEETVVKEDDEKNTTTDKDNKADKDEKTVATTPASRVKIVLIGQSWLELKKDKNVLLSGNFGKGFSYDVPNEKGLIVSVGRHKNVEFYIDGNLTKVASSMKQMNIKLDKFLKNND